MSRDERELRRLVRAFIEEREDFWEFHEGFLNCWTRLPPESLSAARRAGWNEIYAWVLTSIPDPVSPEDAARGVIGAAELRTRLRQHTLSR